MEQSSSNDFVICCLLRVHNKAEFIYYLTGAYFLRMLIMMFYALKFICPNSPFLDQIILKK